VDLRLRVQLSVVGRRLRVEDRASTKQWHISGSILVSGGCDFSWAKAGQTQNFKEISEKTTTKGTLKSTNTFLKSKRLHTSCVHA
jgi:hypothetical protein